MTLLTPLYFGVSHAGCLVRLGLAASEFGLVLVDVQAVRRVDVSRIVAMTWHRPQVARPARVDDGIGAPLADAAEAEHKGHETKEVGYWAARPPGLARCSQFDEAESRT